MLWLFAVLPRAQAADEFLDPDKAFQVSARTLGDTSVEVVFKVAPGYYLYREQLKFTATGASLGAPDLPRGKVKYDETFRKDVETYRDVLRIALPVERADGAFSLVVASQGCADAGLCYPPQQSAFSVSLNGFGGTSTVRKLSASEIPVNAGSDVVGTAGASSSDGSALGSMLQDERFWPVVGAFAGRPVVLDFYADWCVSCKDMERLTLSDATVQRKLSGALLLKEDVTR